MECLLERCPYIAFSYRDAIGNTLLHYAAAHTQYALYISRMVKNKISICNRQGRTPKEIAQLHGNQPALYVFDDVQATNTLKYKRSLPDDCCGEIRRFMSYTR